MRPTAEELIEARRSKQDYEIYHKSFVAASQEAHDLANRLGYEVDQDSWFQNVTTGKKRGRPSIGKSNSFDVALTRNGKPDKKYLHFQVYGMPQGSFELNAYIG